MSVCKGRELGWETLQLEQIEYEHLMDTHKDFDSLDFC